MNDYGSLDKILQRDGFIIYITGRKDNGKTDFSLNLAEYCYLKGYRTKIATNIKTESYMIERLISNLPDLEVWLKESSKKKLFILDEAGLTMPKLRFMASVNVAMMKLMQIIRHYNAGFIGISPSTKNVDSTFQDQDILDAHIKKLSRVSALVKDNIANESYFIGQIHRTSINFKSKDIAEFTFEKPKLLTSLPLCCQATELYAQTKSFKRAGIIMKLEGTEVRRLIWKHIQKCEKTENNKHDGSIAQEEPTPKT